MNVWPCGRDVARDFHHSPSNLAETEGRSEVFGLGARKSLGERVGDHIFGRAVIDSDLPSFYDVTNEVEANVDVFRSSMELLVASESDCGLRIGVEEHGTLRFQLW